LVVDVANLLQLLGGDRGRDHASERKTSSAHAEPALAPLPCAAAYEVLDDRVHAAVLALLDFADLVGNVLVALAQEALERLEPLALKAIVVGLAGLLVRLLLVLVVGLGALAEVELGVGVQVMRAQAAQVVAADALVRELELRLRVGCAAAAPSGRRPRPRRKNQ